MGTQTDLLTVHSTARPLERSGAPWRRAEGFSLIELVIVIVIIGIIAAIAIPRMSRGSAGAADAALHQNLGILRNAVEHYKVEHGGLYPAELTGVTVHDLLTKFSSPNGDVVETNKTSTAYLGPYLRAIPAITVGPNKGMNGIAVSTTSGVPATGAAGIAWLYNAVDGTVDAYTGSITHDDTGRAYASY